MEDIGALAWLLNTPCCGALSAVGWAHVWWQPAGSSLACARGCMESVLPGHWQGLQAAVLSERPPATAVHTLAASVTSLLQATVLTLSRATPCICRRAAAHAVLRRAPRV